LGGNGSGFGESGECREGFKKLRVDEYTSHLCIKFIRYAIVSTLEREE
jgi:hypothetical protein